MSIFCPGASYVVRVATDWVLVWQRMQRQDRRAGDGLQTKGEVTPAPESDLEYDSRP